MADVSPLLDGPTLDVPTNWKRYITRDRLLLLCRVILCERFFYEFYDKIARFSYWNDAIASSGFGSASIALMVLIILLLLVGTPLVVFAPSLSHSFTWRWFLILAGCASLFLFQLPATILFESGGYEVSSSVSILGGLLVATCASF